MRLRVLYSSTVMLYRSALRARASGVQSSVSKTASGWMMFTRTPCRRQFEGGDPHQLGDGGLGAGITAGPGSGRRDVAAADKDRRGVDAFFQEGDAELEQLHVAGQVHFEALGPVHRVHVLEVGAGGEDAGIADEDVQSAVLRITSSTAACTAG